MVTIVFFSTLSCLAYYFRLFYKKEAVMALNINKYAEEANHFFKDVARELDNPGDINHASRVTTTVLHTIRDRITPEESMHLISQLPVILKGIYVDGWKITKKQSKSDTLEEFLNEIRQHAVKPPGRDFGNDQQAKENVSAVLKVMKHYVGEGEIKDIKAQLPEPNAEYIEA
jgi:uncharacterized protein (DUF2267 family)